MSLFSIINESIPAMYTVKEWIKKVFKLKIREVNEADATVFHLK